MRELNKIIVHYAWSLTSMDIGVEDIRLWHLARGFADVGYHFVIRRNSEVESGRPVWRQGAHARGHNEDSIGICLAGGKPDFNFSHFQLLSLFNLITDLATRYNIKEVGGHRNYAASECPGFDVRAWWKTK